MGRSFKKPDDFISLIGPFNEPSQLYAGRGYLPVYFHYATRWAFWSFEGIILLPQVHPLAPFPLFEDPSMG
jgi:hypothetical protein